jgi:hypothetical protein
MKIEKRKLALLGGVYACNSIEVDGQTRFPLASEQKGRCLAWRGPDYAECHTVWDGPEGTTSIVPIPGANGEFIAVQKFYRFHDWEEAKVVPVRPLEDGTYRVTDILHLPYIHRFDLLTVGSRHYFIAGTLATTKTAIDDWSDPGKIWVGEYKCVGPLSLSVLKDGITQNHGYSRLVQDGVMRGLITGREGAFTVTPPQCPEDEWAVEQFMNWPISDIAAIDIDGDGELEFATIEPFHGKYFRVYKKRGGVFEKIFEPPEVTEFHHVQAGRKAGHPRRLPAQQKAVVLRARHANLAAQVGGASDRGRRRAEQRLRLARGGPGHHRRGQSGNRRGRALLRHGLTGSIVRHRT